MLTAAAVGGPLLRAGYGTRAFIDPGVILAAGSGGANLHECQRIATELESFLTCIHVMQANIVDAGAHELDQVGNYYLLHLVQGLEVLAVLRELCL